MYWFVRMKQDSGGRAEKDFTEELWEQGLIGILFGSWTINGVLDEAGTVDDDKLTQGWLWEHRADHIEVFKPEWLHTVRRFLKEMSEGDKVVVSYEEDGSLHIGTLGDGFREDPNPPRNYGEAFKCRLVTDQKRFALEDLPSGYRLVSGTGRGTVQLIKAYEPLVRLLDRHEDGDTDGVRRTFTEMSTKDLLKVLSPQQWEVLCAEYLRAIEGVRPLLLAVGNTLKDVDIYGVDRHGNKVLAQCKNDSAKKSARTVREWAEKVPNRTGDRLYYFVRGGIDGEIDQTLCTTFSGDELEVWLGEDEESQRWLRTI